ncbi:MAG: sigma-70 family RNA polymerase sigma factor [Sandaracinaceae bacterium]|nr:sigma-70 family RNA polymerase sigma factor [Sandaracinaceae bacterium]
MSGHPPGVIGAAAAVPSVAARDADDLSLPRIYEEHFDFVWRSARRMGVAESAVDDVVQEVFLVAHRRLEDFERRSSIRTWLFGILLRVVSDYRRSLRRKGGLAPLPESLPDSGDTPDRRAERQQAVALLHRLLDTLDDDKRAVFVLAELEQMSAPEIADALSVNLNTVYSRLRAARMGFDKALARHQAQEARQCRETT